MGYLSNVMADLSRLSKQLDCRHVYVTGAGYRLCMQCNYKMLTCLICDHPATQVGSEVFCDWCDA